MGCIYQTFKIVLVIVILINTATGYTHLYQLVNNIKGTIGDVSNLRSFKDLAWIPFLIVQVASTLFQFIQLYCLFRELCEDNYMFKHGFKCCFTLVLLIYVISVLPKSILTIIDYMYDSSIKKWWKTMVAFSDSLLSTVLALGFQIVLFMPVIGRALRSAGMCERKIWPTGSKADSMENDPELENKSNSQGRDLCMFVCCYSQAENSQNNSDFGTESTDQGKKCDSKSRVKQMRKTVSRMVDSGMQMKSSIEQRLEKLEAKAVKTKEKKIKEFQLKIEERKKYVRSKISKTDEPSETCEEKNCDDVTDLQSGKTEHGALKRCWTKFKGMTCRCLENRTTCFIVSMALGNFHLFVYVVEVAFIFCFGCFQ